MLVSGSRRGACPSAGGFPSSGGVATCQRGDLSHPQSSDWDISLWQLCTICNELQNS